MITRPYGKGSITYIGAILDDKLMEEAAKWLVKESGVSPATPFTVPDGVEVSARSGGGKRVFVLINFAQEPRQVTFGGQMKLLLSERRGEAVELAPYGVEVVVAP